MYSGLLQKEILRLKEEGCYRSMLAFEGPQNKYLLLNGKKVLNLSSNNYLGLANHPDIIKAAVATTQHLGTGSGGSRLITGTMVPHLDLEERIARFKETEASILFNSGYHANIGTISAIADRRDLILSDKLNHASIIDASILSRAKLRRYPHRDMNFLETLLKKSDRYRKRLIVTDGVFSMDGDIAPLKEISTLAKRYNSIVMLDDAHATGVLGDGGRGTLEYFGINDPGIIQMGTLGKAVGSFGAYIAGKRSLIDYITNKARAFVYTTSLPPGTCSASIAALDIIEQRPELRAELKQKSYYMRERLISSGIDILNSKTHIIPVLAGKAKTAVLISRALLEEGILVQAIRPPTVPEGTSRLRLTIMSNHSIEELTRAAEVVARLVKRYR